MYLEKIQNMKKTLLNALGKTVKYICVLHCLHEYVVDYVLCSGPSMEPTIVSNDVLLTECISKLTHRIDRGDIIIAKCPTNPKQFICKRVIGLPGDKIRTGFASTQIVPIGHVWLQGDNINNSSDSRNYGPVPQGLIRSRAICKIWPLKSITLLTQT